LANALTGTCRYYRPAVGLAPFGTPVPQCFEDRSPAETKGRGCLLRTESQLPFHLSPPFDRALVRSVWQRCGRIRGKKSALFAKTKIGSKLPQELDL
jgi:hypothetical protein